MIIRFILFLIFFYLAWFLVRNLLVKPFKQGYQEKGRGQRGGADFSQAREGEVTLDTKGSGQTHDDKSLGEYIDYEEVEEDKS